MYIDTFLFILVTFLTFLNANISYLTKPLLKWLSRATERERDLIEQKTQLKHDQDQLHMVNNFVKYSKIQRRINAIDDELIDIRGQKTTNNLMTRLMLQHGLKIPLGLMLFLIILMYRSTPVLILDESYDFSPFSWIITYPNKDINAVSVHMWIMCCTAIVQFIKI